MNDHEGRAVTLDNLANIADDLQEKQRLYQTSLALRRRSGNLRGITVSLAGLAYTALDRGDLVEASAYAQEQLALSEQLGYESGLATARHVLGTAACLASDFAIAQRHYEEGLKLTQTTDDRLVRSALTLWLGIVMMRYENLERAYALLPEALVLYQEQQNVSCIGMVLAALAQLAMYQGLVDRAVCLAGAAAAGGRLSHAHEYTLEQVGYTHLQPMACEALGLQAASAAWAAGQAMSLEEAIGYALAQPTG